MTHIERSREVERGATLCVLPAGRRHATPPGRTRSGEGRESMSGALQRIRGGDSWGTSTRTVRGVLARSGLRGPGPAVFEGGETRVATRSGTRVRDRFPATALPGEGERSAFAGLRVTVG